MSNGTGDVADLTSVTIARRRDVARSRGAGLVGINSRERRVF
jgi:hypothetical protein